MTRTQATLTWLSVAALLVAATRQSACAADWPQWGGHSERSFVSGEKHLPVQFGAAHRAQRNGRTVTAPPLNVKWAVRLGSATYSSPAVAGGRVFIGTNDGGTTDPRLPRTQGGVLLCLDEATGRRLWQLRVPQLKTRNQAFNFDQLNLGICSTPTVDGNRVYVVSNRGEVLCLDVNGQADGNDGPFVDEGVYMAASQELPDKPGRYAPGDTPPGPPPVELQPSDGDLVWIYDFVRDLDVWPQDAADGSILVVGDRLYVSTSNGTDRSNRTVPSAGAPDLIVLDKKTGRLLAVNHPTVGNILFHGQWSSPTLARVGDRALIIWGGGDGYGYAFDTNVTGAVAGATGRIERVWWFDANAARDRIRDGHPLPYNKNHAGPSEVIATPVCVDGKVYTTVGQDSQHGEGPGCLSCFTISGQGETTTTGRVWRYEGLRRSFSSVAVTGGLVYTADTSGIVHCLDEGSGGVCWTHDLKAPVFATPLAADGKLYVADERGNVTVFALGREDRVLAVNPLDGAVYATPVAANGVLYVASVKTLHAFASEE